MFPTYFMRLIDGVKQFLFNGCKPAIIINKNSCFAKKTLQNKESTPSTFCSLKPNTWLHHSMIGAPTQRGEALILFLSQA
jgi:hypothetical protein